MLNSICFILQVIQLSHIGFSAVGGEVRIVAFVHLKWFKDIAKMNVSICKIK